MRKLTIFAPSHGTHSYAKIHFAVGEKDESAQTAANEFIPPGKSALGKFRYDSIRARARGNKDETEPPQNLR
jgi:hypothetical protein